MIKWLTEFGAIYLGDNYSRFNMDMLTEASNIDLLKKEWNKICYLKVQWSRSEELLSNERSKYIYYELLKEGDATIAKMQTLRERIEYAAKEMDGKSQAIRERIKKNK